MSADILATNCDQCVSMVRYCFTSTKTVRLVRTGSPGRPPRLSHSSWTLTLLLVVDCFYTALFSVLDQTARIWFYMSDYLFIARVLTALALVVPHETAAVSARSVHTILTTMHLVLLKLELCHACRRPNCCWSQWHRPWQWQWCRLPCWEP